LPLRSKSTSSFSNHNNYQQAKRTKLFSNSPRHWHNFPLKARITTSDKNILPARIKTPRALSTHFAAYNPTAVLINSRAASLKGVRVWWIYLPTKDLLDKLTADIDGSIMDGNNLVLKTLLLLG